MADDHNYDESSPADEFPELPINEDHEEDENTDLENENSDLEDEFEDRVEMRDEEPSLAKISPSQIPLNIRFEIGRVNVSLDELQQMAPGYKLPIDVNPRIINLTVNGKSIGRGELIEVGETVGVKVIELY